MNIFPIMKNAALNKIKEGSPIIGISVILKRLSITVSMIRKKRIMLFINVDSFLNGYKIRDSSIELKKKVIL